MVPNRVNIRIVHSDLFGYFWYTNMYLLLEIEDIYCHKQVSIGSEKKV